MPISHEIILNEIILSKFLRGKPTEHFKGTRFQTLAIY